MDRPAMMLVTILGSLFFWRRSGVERLFVVWMKRHWVYESERDLYNLSTYCSIILVILDLQTPRQNPYGGGLGKDACAR
ncbi:hypothetical protein C7974DRAFT_393631 [Boeremia exigua]|uniref:uncharacterized protein n=1 Tax=Boeremia exigua TaxID=749465 RepID=UPI001E8EB7DC|nr:uncharacterized protein C7974DRAFT_393631 [Boeremia exigua]KAH6629009.1 hypothetical protein C7974DRAFT_393631 [Boeremia exigua]